MSEDFLEACEKERKELDASMREAFRQRDERKAREAKAKQRTESERLQDDLEPIN
jgi:hypothetical protein